MYKKVIPVKQKVNQFCIKPVEEHPQQNFIEDKANDIPTTSITWNKL